MARIKKNEVGQYVISIHSKPTKIFNFSKRETTDTVEYIRSYDLHLFQDFEVDVYLLTVAHGIKQEIHINDDGDFVDKVKTHYSSVVDDYQRLTGL